MCGISQRLQEENIGGRMGSAVLAGRNRVVFLLFVFCGGGGAACLFLFWLFCWVYCILYRPGGKDDAVDRKLKKTDKKEMEATAGKTQSQG